jgi:NAD dependent epimerase/dehydratase family enzyme
VKAHEKEEEFKKIARNQKAKTKELNKIVDGSADDNEKLKQLSDFIVNMVSSSVMTV